MLAFGNPYSPVLTQVSVPFNNPIFGEMIDGKQIQIQAFVQNQRDATRFSVNLCCGSTFGGNVALHFNPRFDQNCIVRNAMVNDIWGPEERDGGMPIVKGQVFEIIILMTKDAYQIAVNGKHFTTFKHRMPMQNVKHLFINGKHMKVNFIKYEEGTALGCGGAQGPGYTPPPYTQDMNPSAGEKALGCGPAPGLSPPPYTPGGFAPPRGTAYPAAGSGSGETLVSPALPLTMMIPGRMYPDKMIFIKGFVNNGAKRFTINLQNGSVIMFHFDVRVDCLGERNVVVRNTKKDGSWGAEERAISHFPFMPNTNFDLIILATPASYKVAVNNAHFVEYSHRLPLAEAITLNISGDAKIHRLHFQ